MDNKQTAGDVARPGISIRAAEIVVALIMIGLGGLVVFDSVRLGFRWGSEGPEAGYFPFYIGAFICISSVITLGQTLRSKKSSSKVFVEWEQLKLVMSVLVPAAFFVLGIQLIGIYVASAAYIAFFMVWLGKYNWIRSVVLGIAISAATFVMFEIWFKVPLFKGAFNPLGIIGY
jgi:Tripartite tricarboxylate transporter TctB family